MTTTTHRINVQFVTQLQSLKAAEREMKRIENLIDQIEADPVNLLGHSPQQVALLRKQLGILKGDIKEFKAGAISSFDSYARGARQANIQQNRLTREITQTTAALARQQKQMQMLMATEDRRLSVANRTRRALGQSFLEAPLYSVSFAAMALIGESIRQYVEFDKTLTRIGIVAERSAESMKIFGEFANNAGKELAVTGRRFAEASLIFLQQGGLAADYATGLAEASIKLANITGTKAEDTSEYITAIANSFKLLESDGLRAGDRIIDMLAALDFSSGSSADEIAEAFTRSASSFAAAGFSAEQASAMIAVVSETTRQSARMVGTGFKTLIGNLAEVRKGSSEFEQISSKLQDVSRSFGMSLSLIDENTKDMKEVPKILQEVADLYNNSSSTAAKYALVEAVAGKEQRDRFIALITNQERYNELLKIAENSTGAATQGQERYMESAAAKIEQVKNEWEELVLNLIDDKTFKSFLDQLSAVLGNFNSAMESGNAFLTVVASISKLLAPLLAAKIFTSQSFNLMALGMTQKAPGETPVRGHQFVNRLPEQQRNQYMQDLQNRREAIKSENQMNAAYARSKNQVDAVTASKMKLRQQLKQNVITTQQFERATNMLDKTMSKLSATQSTLQHNLAGTRAQITTLTASMDVAAQSGRTIAIAQGKALAGMMAVTGAMQATSVLQQENLTATEKTLGTISSFLPAIGALIGTIFGMPVVGMFVGMLAQTVIGFIKVDKAAQKARDSLALLASTARESFESNADRIKFLEAEIKRLERFGLSEKDAENLKNYRNELAKLIPELQTGVDRYGNAILMSNAAISARLRSMEKELEIQQKLTRLEEKRAGLETLRSFQAVKGGVKSLAQEEITSENIFEKEKQLETFKKELSELTDLNNPVATMLQFKITTLEEVINIYNQNVAKSILENKGTYIKAIRSQIDDPESAEAITNALSIASPEKIAELDKAWRQNGEPALLSLSEDILEAAEKFKRELPKSFELFDILANEKELNKKSQDFGISVDALKDIIFEKLKDLNESFSKLSKTGQESALNDLIGKIVDVPIEGFTLDTSGFIEKVRASKGSLNEAYQELIVFYQELAQFTSAYQEAMLDGQIDSEEKTILDSMAEKFKYLKVPRSKFVGFSEGNQKKAEKLQADKAKKQKDIEGYSIDIEKDKIEKALKDIADIDSQLEAITVYDLDLGSVEINFDEVTNTTKAFERLYRKNKEFVDSPSIPESLGLSELRAQAAEAAVELAKLTEGTEEYEKQLAVKLSFDLQINQNEILGIESEIADAERRLLEAGLTDDERTELLKKVATLQNDLAKAYDERAKKLDEISKMSKTQLDNFAAKQQDYFDDLVKALTPKGISTAEMEKAFKKIQEAVAAGNLTLAQAAAARALVVGEMAELNTITDGVVNGMISGEQYREILQRQFKFITPTFSNYTYDIGDSIVSEVGFGAFLDSNPAGSTKVKVHSAKISNVTVNTKALEDAAKKIKITAPGAGGPGVKASPTATAAEVIAAAVGAYEPGTAEYNAAIIKQKDLAEKEVKRIQDDILKATGQTSMAAVTPKVLEGLSAETKAIVKDLFGELATQQDLVTSSTDKLTESQRLRNKTTLETLELLLDDLIPGTTEYNENLKAQDDINKQIVANRKQSIRNLLTVTGKDGKTRTRKLSELSTEELKEYNRLLEEQNDAEEKIAKNNDLRTQGLMFQINVLEEKSKTLKEGTVEYEKNQKSQISFAEKAKTEIQGQISFFEKLKENGTITAEQLKELIGLYGQMGIVIGIIDNATKNLANSQQFRNKTTLEILDLLLDDLIPGTAEYNKNLEDQDKINKQIVANRKQSIRNLLGGRTDLSKLTPEELKEYNRLLEEQNDAEEKIAKNNDLRTQGLMFQINVLEEKSKTLKEGTVEYEKNQKSQISFAEKAKTEIQGQISFFEKLKENGTITAEQLKELIGLYGQMGIVIGIIDNATKNLANSQQFRNKTMLEILDLFLNDLTPGTKEYNQNLTEQININQRIVNNRKKSISDILTVTESDGTKRTRKLSELTPEELAEINKLKGEELAAQNNINAAADLITKGLGFELSLLQEKNKLLEKGSKSYEANLKLQLIELNNLKKINQARITELENSKKPLTSQESAELTARYGMAADYDESITQTRFEVITGKFTKEAKDLNRELNMLDENSQKYFENRLKNLVKTRKTYNDELFSISEKIKALKSNNDPADLALIELLEERYGELLDLIKQTEEAVVKARFEVITGKFTKEAKDLKRQLNMLNKENSNYFNDLLKNLVTTRKVYNDELFNISEKIKALKGQGGVLSREDLALVELLEERYGELLQLIEEADDSIAQAKFDSYTKKYYDGIERLISARGVLIAEGKEDSEEYIQSLKDEAKLQQQILSNSFAAISRLQAAGANLTRQQRTELKLAQEAAAEAARAIIDAEKQIAASIRKIYEKRYDEVSRIVSRLEAQLTDTIEESSEFIKIQDKIIDQQKELFKVNQQRLDQIVDILNTTSLSEEVRNDYIKEQNELYTAQYQLAEQINNLIEKRAIDEFNLALYGTSNLEALKNEYEIRQRLIDEIIDAHERLIEQTQLELEIQTEINNTTNETYKTNLKYLQNKLKDVKLTKQVIEATRSQINLLKALSAEQETGPFRLTRAASGAYRFAPAAQDTEGARQESMRAAAENEKQSIASFREISDDIFSLQQQIPRMKIAGEDTSRLENLLNQLEEQRNAQAQEMIRSKTVSALVATGKGAIAARLTAGRMGVEEASSFLTPEQREGILTSAQREINAVISSERLLIQSNFSLVDSNGRLIDSHGRIFDSQGRLVDSSGRLIDSQGRLLDSDGRLIDSQGRLIDSEGRLIDAQGRLIDAQGRLVDAHGRLIGSNSTLVNAMERLWAKLDERQKIDININFTPPAPTAPSSEADQGLPSERGFGQGSDKAGGLPSEGIVSRGGRQYDIGFGPAPVGSNQEADNIARLKNEAGFAEAELARTVRVIKDRTDLGLDTTVQHNYLDQIARLRPGLASQVAAIKQSSPKAQSEAGKSPLIEVSENFQYYVDPANGTILRRREGTSLWSVVPSTTSGIPSGILAQSKAIKDSLSKGGSGGSTPGAGTGTGTGAGAGTGTGTGAGAGATPAPPKPTVRNVYINELAAPYTTEYVKTTKDAQGNITHHYEKVAVDKKFETGGYTGDFDGGKLAVLHEKELVLNKLDTKNILDAVKIMRSIPQVASKFIPTAPRNTDSNMGQNITINAEFPNVSSADEIKKAFASMSSRALQYAYRTKSY